MSLGGFDGPEGAGAEGLEEPDEGELAALDTGGGFGSDEGWEVGGVNCGDLTPLLCGLNCGK